MMDGKLTITWQQFSHLIAAVLNTQLGRKQAAQPHQVNPYQRSKQSEHVAVQLDDVLGLE